MSCLNKLPPVFIDALCDLDPKLTELIEARSGRAARTRTAMRSLRMTSWRSPNPFRNSTLSGTGGERRGVGTSHKAMGVIELPRDP